MRLHIILRFLHPRRPSLPAAFRRSWRAGFRPLLGLTLVIVTALAGCARPVAAFPFTVDGARLALYVGPPKEGDAEGTPLFSLARAVAIDRAGMALFLRFAVGEPDLSVDVYGRESSGGAERVVRAELPVVSDGESEVELMVPVPAGAAITGFRVVGPGSRSGLRLEAAGIASLGPGVALGPKLVSLRPGFGYAVTGGPAGAATARGGSPESAAGGGSAAAAAKTATTVESFTFAPVTREILGEQHASQVQVVLTYAFGGSADRNPSGAAAAAGEAAAAGAPPAATTAGAASANGGALGAAAGGRVELTFARGKEERSYLLTPGPGEHAVYVYSASCRFSPESLRVDSSDPSFRVIKLEVNPFSPDKLASGAPIPADLGTILTYDPADWRTRDFELFSWSLVPDVLVFDFRSYDIQGDYLSRFAYFIEKRGFAGRLMTRAEVRGLHGWNAHDYRPQDIARFYQTAQDEHFTLRPEERRLRDLLSQNGVIKQVGGRWEPGKGALISVAQSSWYLLRYLLLTHEAFHGIYFTHPEYRAEVHTLWDRLNPEEREFWRLFLGSQDYNTEDSYLVINEFQAYLMQQPLQAVDARYSGWAVGYVENRFPSQTPALKRMMQEQPEIFLDTAKRLDAAVYRVAGVHAGDLVTLVPQHWK